MPADIATLQLKVDTSDISKADAFLNKFSNTSKQAEASAKKMGAEAEATFNKTRTAAERYEAELNKLNAMRRAGAISEETHARAVKMAANEMNNATTKGSALGRMFTGLGATLGMVFSVATAGQILRIADSMNVMESQLKSVTQAGDSYNGVYKQILEIANRNQTAMGSTADCNMYQCYKNLPSF